MNCRLADKWIDRALDGALAPREQALLNGHLAACAQCRKEWEVLRTADALLRAPRPVRAPQGLLREFRERVAQEALQEERRQEARRRAWPWFWPVASFAAAGATAALVIAFNLAPPGSPVRRGERPEQPEMARTVTPSPSRPETLPPASAAAPRVPPRPLGAERPRSDGLTREPRAVFRGDEPKSPTKRKGGERLALSGLALKPGPAEPENLRFVERVPRLEAAAGGPAPEPERPATANFEARVALRNGYAAPAPIALEADVQQAQSEVLPPEFNVSPAVLTALRRDVEVNAAAVPVREALRSITETADVVVKIDPTVQPLRVTVEQDGEPLWVALQKVAQQGKLQIVPEANHLVLRPEKAVAGGAPGAPAERFGRADAEALAKPSVGKKPRPFVIERIPDRAVWPADWGTLPERGFEPPGPEDLPPAVASLPRAMDEARLVNRSYRNNAEPARSRGPEPRRK